MIFLTDDEGKASYLSREWTDFTGQTLDDARNYGWVAVVHPEDVEIIRSTVAKAVASHCEFTVQYRLRSLNGNFEWVSAGAVPSYGRPGRKFLGFFGSITRLLDIPALGLSAYGSLGQYVPAPNLVDHTGAPMEIVADHLLALHSMIAQIDNPRLSSIVSVALQVVGEELAAMELDERSSTKVH